MFAFIFHQRTWLYKPEWSQIIYKSRLLWNWFFSSVCVKRNSFSDSSTSLVSSEVISSSETGNTIKNHSTCTFENVIPPLMILIAVIVCVVRGFCVGLCEKLTMLCDYAPHGWYMMKNALGEDCRIIGLKDGKGGIGLNKKATPQI